MTKYYRFQNDAPRVGEIVHCYTSKTEFFKFVNMMKAQDPDFMRMSFWELEGQFIKHDEGDVQIKVTSVKKLDRF